MFIIFTTVCLLSTISFAQAYPGVSLHEKMNFYEQHKYPSKMHQPPLAMENVIDKSVDLALRHCQAAFKWQPWNCPSTDFQSRRSAQPLAIDREDAFVTAIATAAILYSITKDCASGLVAGCGCQEDDMTVQCSDDPTEAEALYHDKMNTVFYDDFHSSVKRHNHIATITLMRKSLITQCTCNTMGPNGCIEETCYDILKPFVEVAKDLRRMYDEAQQFSNNGKNSQIMWENMPLDAFAYVKESPNYCEPDAVPHWNGMSGRQCSYGNNGVKDSSEERDSCQNLCGACGLRVRSKNVIVERRCNCKYTWSFQLHCETCMAVEKQHYCY